MVTEDYVSCETAKLLKENGFDSDEVGCHGGFYSERCYEYGYGIKTQSGQEVGIVYDDLSNSDLEYDEYLRPTLQMAMKWLRDIFHLEIYPFHDAIQENNDWWYRIEQHSKGCSLPEHESNVIYKTYEEACEEAIKYCLENLV